MFLPLRANGRGERFGSGFVALCSTNSGAQRLQHFAVGFVFDALRQRSSLNGSAIQNAFDGCGIRFTTQCGADLLRHGSTGAGILQRVLFLPLRADGGSKRFGSGVVVLRFANSGTQRLQHFAVGFGANACGQGRQCGLLSGDFGGDAVENGFNGGGVGFACATEGGDDTLRDGVAGRFVLQAVVRLQLATDAGGDGVLCGIALRFAHAAAQGFKQVFVVGGVEACRGFARFFGGAVEHGFDQRRVFVAVATQYCRHLFGDGGADGAVLQAVLVLPLVADGGGEHFLDVGAGGVVQAGAQGVHHHAVGVLAYAFGQDARHAVRYLGEHGVQYAFVNGTFAGERRFQVGDDVVTGFAFGGNALLQPLAADAVGEYRLHIFIGTGGEATAQGAEHPVVGLFADAVRGFVLRYAGGNRRGEAGLYRDGGITGSIRLGEDVGNPLCLRPAFLLEAGEQALCHRFAQRRVVGNALLPLAADGFGQRRLHIGIRLAHAQAALQGTQRLVVAFFAAEIGGGCGCDCSFCGFLCGNAVVGEADGGRFRRNGFGGRAGFVIAGEADCRAAVACAFGACGE